MMNVKRLGLFSAAFLCLVANAFTAPQTIRPGELWPDNRGKHIQAHGGGIIKLDDTYYWFGEDRAQDNDRGRRYVSCYSSKDLAHWTFRNQVLKLADPENFGRGWVLERPKVFYNAKTKKFVMYMHIDGPLPGQNRGYGLARVGVAICDTVDGDYQYLRSFRPLGLESRDLGQFIDDDGSAYLIFESRPTKGFFIAKLSDDYLDVEKKVCFIEAPLEGGAIVHYGDLYYVVGSHLTGWRPNPNMFATAKSLAGPWSEFKDIAPPESNTYGSQSTMLLKVAGTKTNTVIFMGDIWKPQTQWDSRYLWMPVEIGDGKLRLPEPGHWTLDVETGEAVLSKPIAEMDLNISSNVVPTAVSIAANAKSPGEPLVHFWSACVGAGRANEGLRASWLEQLKLVHDECGFQYVRFHGLFHSDMFVYHRANGEPVYNWQYIDDLFDRMLEIGVRPFVELGFNPIDPPGGRLIDGASVSGTTTLTNESADASTNGFRRGGLGGNRGAAIGQFWWRGNAVPPSDNESWAELVERFTRHCIERYGIEEVRRWYFEVWNEPNLQPFFRGGTQQQYFELYKASALAIKKVDSKLRVGGPATSNFHVVLPAGTSRATVNHEPTPDDVEALDWRPVWVEDFIAYCHMNQVPLDFIATHPILRIFRWTILSPVARCG
jgi:hypothetical protein